MGNEQSHDFSQCGEHRPRAANTVLNRPCQVLIQLSSDIPQIKRSKILLSYITNDNIIIAVDAHGASSYILESGTQREQYILEHPNYVVSAYYSHDNLILALNIGIFVILDSNLLSFVKEIKPLALLPGIITAMCEGPGNLLIAGHSSGDVTMWDIQSGKIIDEFHSGYPPTAVSSMVYSHKYSVIITGFDNLSVRSTMLANIKPVRAFSTKTDRRVVDLPGINGRCSGLAVYDQRNIVVGLDSTNRTLFVWDFIGGYQLLATEIPPIFDRNMPIVLQSISTFADDDSIAIGFSNNKVVWGEILYDDSQLKYFFKWKGKSSIDRDGEPSTIHYCRHLDSFAIGNSKSQVYVFHNLSDLFYQNSKAPPMFSLKSYQPKVQKLEKQENLPIVSVGPFQIKPRGSSVHKDEEQEKVQPINNVIEEQKAPRTVSEETLKKIRERVEGKKKPKKVEEPKAEATDPLDTQKPVEVKSPEAKEPAEIPQPIQTTLPQPAKPEESPSKSPPKPEIKKKITPFQRFVQSKKSEFLSEDPSLTHKQIVLKATELWGLLNEQEKHLYEEDRAPDLTS
ncbi:unnamed protein product [Blepharisma stoltei]|uniref:HMG box domain-containing protein n=1 Tax=Blepharisma stoltei TaxID=1481888 RepID=A0AAU9J5M8_9CILI|nr:unnamed protein product [Blepharisma stoltei]